MKVIEPLIVYVILLAGAYIGRTLLHRRPNLYHLSVGIGAAIGSFLLIRLAVLYVMPGQFFLWFPLFLIAGMCLGWIVPPRAK